MSTSSFSALILDLPTIAARSQLLFLGLCKPDLMADSRRFDAWIREGKHAGMTYLERYQHLRGDLEAILPQTQTVIVWGQQYGPTRPPSRDGIPVARYALHRDYHKVMRRQIAVAWDEAIRTHLGGGTNSGQHRVVVDTAPVLERAIARQSGRGFVGKNTCWIDPQLGSYIHLGLLLTTLDLAPMSAPRPDTMVHRTQRDPNTGGCGTCRRCQVHCPTHALDAAYTLDARRCLAYWSIEHRGVVPDEFWPYFADSIFGCDVCQQVCPYNRGPQGLINPRSTLPTLEQVAAMSEQDYIEWFAGTPMTRAGRAGLRRNALMSLYARNSPGWRRTAEHLQHDPSPVLQATALRCLDPHPPPRARVGR